MRALSVKIDKTREVGKIGRQVRITDNEMIVEPNTILVDADNGDPLVIFGRFDDAHTRLKSHLPAVPYQGNMRVTRMNNDFDNVRAQELPFGYHPKRPVFNLPAGATAVNSSNPVFYAEILRMGQEMMDLYERYSQSRFDRQWVMAGAINDRWRMPGTFFTGGVVNDTANLDYHYDRGNFTGCWSAMAVFLRDIGGGNLHIPSLGVRLDIQDETFVLFDGQSLLHGVEPIIKKSKHGRRFSIVYYALELLKKAGTYDEELQAIRQVDLRKHKKNAK